MTKILLVEDDTDVARMITDSLKEQRYEVEVASDGDTGFEYVRQGHYDVIILDWDLPGLSGIEICRRFRAKQGTTPILILTGKSQTAETEQGLDAGADDYLKKPFSMRELLARIRALARRGSTVVGTVLKVQDLELDPVKHRLRKRGREVHLLPKDFALLEFLMRHPDEIFSSEVLINRVWNMDSETSIESLRTAFRRIRKVIDDTDDEQNSMIENLRRVGYRLKQQ